MILPKYVKLGHSALRLVGKTYYRDGGNWNVQYRIVDGELISWNWGQGMPWLHKVPLVEITEEEWRKDNAGYV